MNIESIRTIINKELLKVEEYNSTIQFLEKQKLDAYNIISLYKKKAEDTYSHYLGKKANCVLQDGTKKVCVCSKVMVNDDLKPLPKFSTLEGKIVKVLVFDFI